MAGRFHARKPGQRPGARHFVLELPLGQPCTRRTPTLAANTLSAIIRPHPSPTILRCKESSCWSWTMSPTRESGQTPAGRVRRDGHIPGGIGPGRFAMDPAAATASVIVSDISMPGEDGYEFIRKVRALSPENGGRTQAATALTAFARARRPNAAAPRRLSNACGQTCRAHRAYGRGGEPLALQH